MDSLSIPQVTIKYSITFVVNPGFAIIVVPHLALIMIFFEHYCHMLSTFHHSIFSEMAQFCFVSTAIRK